MENTNNTIKINDELKILKYGLIINLNKYNSFCEIIHKTFICDNLEDCKNQLINFLIDEFKDLNIDFPLELNEFEYIILNQNYINTNIFNYMIFYDDKWITPWELDDIYTELLEKIHELDIKNFIPNKEDNAESQDEDDA
jgi:hypothetical protein